MRRVVPAVLAILGFLFTTGSCMTQRQGQGLTQRGIATQDMTDDILTAAHPALPRGSRARVTNIANGKEIEVTITDRIAPSSQRVIDLSPGAALALDIGFGGPVIVNGTFELEKRPMTQRGMATQEMTGSFFAAHSILPTGSTAKVTNLANNKEVTVTITRRLNPSDTRIIDLSPGAAAALDIGKGGPVIIEVLSIPEPSPLSSPQQR